MPVKSLMELAAMACIKNIKGLESIGDYLPYHSMRHILLKVDNAHQLRQLEVNSPQLQGETGEIWIKIIEKDFPMEFKNNAYKPPTPDKWYRVWEKYKKEHNAAIEESESRLKSALAGLREDKEKNTSKIVERKFLPRAGRVGPKRTLGPRDHSSTSLTFNLGSRTKTNTGASIMRKVRREVKEIATIHGNLSRPVRAGTGASELKKAPAAMIGEYQRAAQPQYKTAAQQPVVEQYEQRATFISDSEPGDDDYDYDREEGDVFGEVVKKPTAASSSTTSSSSSSDTTNKAPLMKRKTGILRASKPMTTTTKQTTQKQDDTTNKPIVSGRGSATLANKFGQRATTTTTTTTTSSTTTNRPRARASSSTEQQVSPEPPTTSTNTSRQEDAEAEGYHLPATKTAKQGAPSPTTPEEVIASLSPPPAQTPLPRKRKAVDIFMRRKKRAM
ncbi:hypothetical protein L249_3373 [Ophiocordyceps polyrhachis-furcata BCC 54312]|uniref:Elongin-A n=1 Tax=Ophiocordyceps polyrhachis-furcata BCC 54312 TaxID=1330021 RepID=A0A367LMH6_9HYPO|nr:hypothetical protein L249_3373 [Ophiocordyceps polyrhachis-furcata BCC 54312]